MAARLKPALIAATAMFALSALAEPPTRETSKTILQKLAREHTPDNDNRKNRPGDDRRKPEDGKSHYVKHRHYNPEEFRKLLKSELSHIPTLNKPMERLMDIQAERYTLQNERRNVKIEHGADQNKTVGRFHELLKKDMQLGEESRSIVQNIGRDMPKIQQEMGDRKRFLQQSLDSAAKQADTGKTSTTQAEALRRSQRCLEFLDRRLKDLESRPERMDILSRMLRGIPMDESGPRGNMDTPPPPPDADNLDKLQERRRHLQRQLQEVETDIDRLRKKENRDK